MRRVFRKFMQEMRNRDGWRRFGWHGADGWSTPFLRPCVVTRTVSKPIAIVGNHTFLNLVQGPLAHSPSRLSIRTTDQRS
ncbi:hypothetical protein GGR19_003448 [Croceicoccus naphthovorans]|nr:hypothetical protein [Croceicoccus naphthovorans]